MLLNQKLTRSEEDQALRHKTEMADLNGFQQLRRTALANTQKEERDALLQRNQESRASTERTFDTDFELFVNTAVEQRAQMQKRHGQDRQNLLDELNASDPTLLAAKEEADTDDDASAVSSISETSMASTRQ